MLREKIAQKIFKQPFLGLKKFSKDKRDLVGWRIFGIDYKPKYRKKFLEPLTVKNQYANTCGWAGEAGMKEIDEKIELDERVLVMIAKREGKISGDGFSNLRDNEKMVLKFGIAEKGLLKKGYRNWNEYSNYSYLTKEILDNALKHRSKSYLSLSSISEIYKAIDDGRPVSIGISWRTSFNMSGGFSWPWVLNYIKGLFVGGHKIYVYGYDLEYRNKPVFKCRNSFGVSYGDKGDFYIYAENLAKDIKVYGAFINYDLDKNTIKWLMEFQNRIVKGKNPEVYLIQGEEKRKFPDLATFYAHGCLDEDIVKVDDEYLREIKDGKDINFWEGEVVKSVKALIQQKQNLEIIFKKYFNELF